MLTFHSGLDNAGKTTIVKKIMNEDVNNVSPTLGFIIKTIDYNGYAVTNFEHTLLLTEPPGTSLTFVNSSTVTLQHKPTNALQGMSAARRHFAHIGGIISKRLML